MSGRGAANDEPEYDPQLRKGRGVWYTPAPVVTFIVRAVDDILVSEFNLTQGLADKSKVKMPMLQKDGSRQEVDVHRVQILDPATGTGTFLAAIIDKVYEKFANQKGMWSAYCGEHLIPRLNGFEILMASYAMAHFKLDMKLKETGYYGDEKNRLRVFLTNSLEEAPDKTQELPFAVWLAREAREANRVKRDTPLMVVVGNPPYNVSTQNNIEWIKKLLDDYKAGLHEKKLNLDDDYIKFIRYGQHLVEKNESGVLAYISNNSFIDGVTHRVMRKRLLECFDKIYILDLHGSAMKKETAPDGGKDENVFDIMQGVSINIFIKTKHKKQNAAAQVFHSSVHGKRDYKYTFLIENRLSDIPWQEISRQAPYFFFVPKNFSNEDEYKKGFSITELFQVYNNAIKTDRDALFIDTDIDALKKRIGILLRGDFDQTFKDFYNVNDSSSYKLTALIQDKRYDDENIHPILYRPFDIRHIYYQPGITSRPAYNVMRHIKDDNVSLLTCRQQSTYKFQHVFVSNILSQICTLSNQGSENTFVFPLYRYPESDSLDVSAKRQPNLNHDVVDKIAAAIGLRFTEEKEAAPETFAPIDILDYMYALLHSSAYRKKFTEFLKIDFPRVPYPSDGGTFRLLAALGASLRKIHLLENVDYAGDLAKYPVGGENKIDKVDYRDGKVWINKTQYFDRVPVLVWEVSIGGYQPAQKWLKDRRETKLSFDDIEWYQKIVTALHLTLEIQQHIDEAVKLSQRLY
jgi:predicted helicase